MPVSDASLDLVVDSVNSMLEIRSTRRQAQLRVGDSPYAVLTNAERDALRDRLLAQFQTLRDLVIAQVAGWSG